MRSHRVAQVVVAALVLLIAAPTPGPSQDVLAARTLKVGTVLREADLRVPDREDADVAELLAGLVGLETRRAIYTGRPVVAADLGPPTLVQRNAVVVMIYSDRGLGIRTEGRALESGGAGEVVRVINLTSRQSILATVTGLNQVEVRR
jgi:flagella basal body P-ring formation protein FlgA